MSSTSPRPADRVTSMSLLHRLPIELCQTVSLSWLDLIDLARLDSAVCAHQERATFLKAVFAANCVYDYSRYFGKEKTRKGALFYKPEFHEWMLLRGVRLSSLVSFPKCERVLHHKRAFMEVIRTSGTCLKTVQTHMDFDLLKVALYTHCTVLERLECGAVGKRGGLDRLLEVCPSLQHLTFESTDASALEVLQEFGSQIRSLRMANDNKYSLQRPQWANLVPHLLNLTELEVGPGCYSETVLTAVGQHCPHLRALSVTSYATSASGAGSQALLAATKGCPNLERLHAAGSLYMSGNVWLEILHSCKKLNVLQVRSFHFGSDEVMAVLARDFPALRELQVSYFTDPHRLSPQHIASWPLLEVLSLGNMSVTDELLYALATYSPRLRSIQAAICRGITDAGVTALVKGCPRLEQVDLGNCVDITLAALKTTVTHCRYLERLSIHQADAAVRITREEAEPYMKLKLGDINSYALLDALTRRGK